ncbi:pheST operon leader peptide PheM [Xenorhabdus sp. SGI246]
MELAFFRFFFYFTT